MIAIHQVDSVSFEDEQIILIVDDNVIRLPLKNVSTKLEKASDLQRNLFVISPSGYGIHWPLLDEDLSVTALLKAAGF
jgi:hypothetical protein